MSPTTAACLLLALHAAAADGAPPPEAASPSATAVLPVQMRLEDPAAAASASLLTNALTAQLGQVAELKVISPDEVAALLQEEGERQQLGCTDDGCLAEIAGLLGARYLVTGEVESLGSTLSWRAALLDQRSGTVVRRATVRGRTVTALLAQAEELAAALMGKTEALALQGRDAARKLGFTNEGDLAQFRDFRAQHPESTVGEALTEFILVRNRESRRLAVAQAGLFLLSGVLLMPTVMLGWAPTMMPAATPDPTLSAVVGLVVGTLGLLALAAGMATATAGLVLLVVDVLDLGRVAVRRSGCCRQDADILDAQRNTADLRAAGLVTLLSGPVAAAGSVALFIGMVSASTVITAVTDQDIGGDVLPEWALGPAYVGFLCAPPVLLSFLCLSVPAGLLLLARPEAPLVEDEEGAR
ncbi:MAG: hypothetical protein AB2A00_41550 [Myxococcota bacterium]